MELIFIMVPAKAKSSARETPVTMSGFVMGMLVMVMTRRRMRARMEWIPTAAMVPRMVAITLDSTAMIRELPSRRNSESSRNSAPYCEKVNPFHVAMSVPLLKEEATRTIMGI